MERNRLKKKIAAGFLGKFKKKKRKSRKKRGGKEIKIEHLYYNCKRSSMLVIYLFFYQFFKSSLEMWVVMLVRILFLK